MLVSPADGSRSQAAQLAATSPLSFHNKIVSTPGGASLKDTFDLVVRELNERTKYARLRFIGGRGPRMQVMQELPVEIRFDNQMRPSQPVMPSAAAFPQPSMPQQVTNPQQYPAANAHGASFPVAQQPLVPGMQGSSVAPQPQQPAPQPSPATQLPAPQRRVSFYIEHFGQHTVNYHDVVVADTYVVLVFDTRWTMSGMYVPPTGEYPINIAMQVEGDPNTYLVSPTVVDFSYQHLRFAVLQRRASFSEEELRASQASHTVNSGVMMDTAPQAGDLDDYQPYADDNDEPSQEAIEQ